MLVENNRNSTPVDFHVFVRLDIFVDFTGSGAVNTYTTAKYAKTNKPQESTR